MQRFPRINEARRKQLWLLLLAPWLWLSGFSEAMHHHTFIEGAPASVVATSSHSASSHSASANSHHEALSLNTLCAICQWQHSNQANTFVLSPLAPIVDASIPHASYTLALLSRDGAISRSRGPPSC